MTDSAINQNLKKIVAEMGREFVCRHPGAFAGAILDVCRADDVKLLTNVLRAHYGGKLMAMFIDGHDDAATWTQQKAFLIDESGMNADNAENVLDALWQAMDWQRPQPSKPEPEPVREAARKVEPQYRKEYVRVGPSEIPEATKPGPEIRAANVHASSGDRKPEGEKYSTSGPVEEKERAVADNQAGQEIGAQAQERRSKAIPVVITAVWLFLAYQLSQESSAGDILTRIQNGDLRLALFVAAPVLATVFVCVKGVPGLLKGLGQLVLGFVAGYNWVTAFYWLDRYVLKLGFVFSTTTLGAAVTCLIVIPALFVGVSAGRACGKVSD